MVAAKGSRRIAGIQPSRAAMPSVIAAMPAGPANEGSKLTSLGGPPGQAGTEPKGPAEQKGRLWLRQGAVGRGDQGVPEAKEPRMQWVAWMRRNGYQPRRRHDAGDSVLGQKGAIVELVEPRRG